MNLMEILNLISENSLELEVYQALHKWFIIDRDKQIREKNVNAATVRAVKKIVEKSTNPKTAIEGIAALCE